ncbi:hypothetical protein NM688_g28 [Phlebia brevispora]|uniref:Uncharacterized protein n=1 Tax=Phlebia brevispora TaxID=194682 RepID=A0ACC1TFU4_9APHY|nr:hypothetical protein NM688_g28 [Phlebia brevispora]
MAYLSRWFIVIVEENSSAITSQTSLPLKESNITSPFMIYLNTMVSLNALIEQFLAPFALYLQLPSYLLLYEVKLTDMWYSSTTTCLTAFSILRCLMKYDMNNHPKSTSYVLEDRAFTSRSIYSQSLHCTQLLSHKVSVECTVVFVDGPTIEEEPSPQISLPNNFNIPQYDFETNPEDIAQCEEDQKMEDMGPLPSIHSEYTPSVLRSMPIDDIDIPPELQLNDPSPPPIFKSSSTQSQRICKPSAKACALLEGSGIMEEE